MFSDLNSIPTILLPRIETHFAPRLNFGNCSPSTILPRSHSRGLLSLRFSPIFAAWISASSFFGYKIRVFVVMSVAVSSDIPRSFLGRSSYFVLRGMIPSEQRLVDKNSFPSHFPSAGDLHVGVSCNLSTYTEIPRSNPVLQEFLNPKEMRHGFSAQGLGYQDAGIGPAIKSQDSQPGHQQAPRPGVGRETFRYSPGENSAPSLDNSTSKTSSRFSVESVDSSISENSMVPVSNILHCA